MFFYDFTWDQSLNVSEAVALAEEEIVQAVATSEQQNGGGFIALGIERSG